MPKRRVLVLCDSPQNLGAGDEAKAEFTGESWRTERDVLGALRELGHDARPAGIRDDLHLLINEVKEFEPDVVFNLMELFDDRPGLDANVAGLLEMLGVPFTGCGALGLQLCKDKSLAKKILSYHKIRNPHFQVLFRGRRVKRSGDLKFPVLVKPLVEDASYGISMASFVEDDAAFADRVRYLQDGMGHDVIVEEYIEGRELYVGILGGKRLRVFPPRELRFGQMPEDGPRFATFKAKWDMAYRKKWGITNVFARGLDDAAARRIRSVCRRAYRRLRITGYARIDLRLNESGEPYVIEVNPNPHLERWEDFAMSAEKAGLKFPKLIQKILDLALAREE